MIHCKNCLLASQLQNIRWFSSRKFEYTNMSVDYLKINAQNRSYKKYLFFFENIFKIARQTQRLSKFHRHVTYLQELL